MLGCFMMMKREKIISCVGTSFIPPIYILYKKLSEYNFQEVSEPIRRSSIENGYSVSIIVLGILMLESLIARLKYFSRSKFKKEPSYIFFEKRYKDRELSQKIRELYTIRHSIAHNHIWGNSYNWNQNFSKTNPYTRWLKKSFRSNHILNTVNIKNKKTIALGLNIIPTYIGVRDMKIVLKTVNEILLFLEKRTRNLNISTNPYKYGKNSLSFTDFVSKIRLLP